MTTATIAAPPEDPSPPHRTSPAEGGVVSAPGPDVRAAVPRRSVARLRARVGPTDAGMATAEYAIATVAAAGFAGLLLLILRSGEVRELLLGIVRGALQV